MKVPLTIPYQALLCMCVCVCVCVCVWVCVCVGVNAFVCLELVHFCESYENT